MMAPLGRFDSVPSAINGEILTYYTPPPISELIKPWRQTRSTKRGASLAEELALLTLASSRRGSDVVDLRAFDSSDQVLLGNFRIRTRSDLMTLASLVVGQAQSFRQSLCFTGGAVASRAEHVFTPCDRIPPLFDDLARYFEELPSACDSITEAAIVCFFVSLLHPFKDGNGRFSRALSISAAKQSGDAHAGIVYAVFQIANKRKLSTQIWPAARQNGLEQFLMQAATFERALSDGMDDSGVRAIMIRATESAERVARGSAHKSRLLLRTIFTSRGVAVEDIQRILGCSGRVASHAVAEMRESIGFNGRSDAAIDASPLRTRVREIVDNAVSLSG